MKRKRSRKKKALDLSFLDRWNDMRKDAKVGPPTEAELLALVDEVTA